MNSFKGVLEDCKHYNTMQVNWEMIYLHRFRRHEHSVFLYTQPMQRAVDELRCLSKCKFHSVRALHTLAWTYKVAVLFPNQQLDRRAISTPVIRKCSLFFQYNLWMLLLVSNFRVCGSGLQPRLNNHPRIRLWDRRSRCWPMQMQSMTTLFTLSNTPIHWLFSLALFKYGFRNLARLQTSAYLFRIVAVRPPRNDNHSLSAL